MPEGLTNCPSGFPTVFMNDIFADMIDDHCHHLFGMTYSSTRTTLPNTGHVREVLRRSTLTDFLPCRQMRISRHFSAIPQIYAVSRRPYHGTYKVQIIQNWPEPEKVKDIQSFLGFATSIVTSFSDTLKSPFRSCI